MRTTLTLEDDVAALIEAERERTGETFREAVNRLLRRGVEPFEAEPAPALPLLACRPTREIVDVSAVLGELDDEQILGRR